MGDHLLTAVVPLDIQYSEIYLQKKDHLFGKTGLVALGWCLIAGSTVHQNNILPLCLMSRTPNRVPVLI